LDNSLLEFYKALCDMIGVSIDDEGKLYMLINNDKVPYLIDGKQAYLPTKENIKTMTDMDENGNIMVVKSLFNPLSENVSSGTNKSFSKVKRTLEMLLFGAVYHVGGYLLTQVANTEDEIHDIDVIKYASLIGRTKTTSKKIINEKTLINWKKIYDSISDKHINKKYINFRIVKGGKIDTIKYNRVGTVEFPLGEELLSVGKDKVVIDVKLQRNDITSFLSIFEFIAGDIDKVKDGIQVGSLNKLSPSMHVLLSMYMKIYESIKDICKQIEKTTDDESTKNMVNLKPLPYDVANLSDIIDSFENELRKIPNDTAAVIKSKTELTNGSSNLQQKIANGEPKRVGFGGQPVQTNTVQENNKPPFDGPYVNEEQSNNNFVKPVNAKRIDTANPSYVRPSSPSMVTHQQPARVQPLHRAPVSNQQPTSGWGNRVANPNQSVSRPVPNNSYTQPRHVATRAPMSNQQPYNNGPVRVNRVRPQAGIRRTNVPW